MHMPKDCPSFCSGCINCILKREHTCKAAEYIQKIAATLLESDLIVMMSPAYVMHTTGAMKSLHKKAPECLDGKYWAEKRWLDKVRLWRT